MRIIAFILLFSPFLFQSVLAVSMPEDDPWLQCKNLCSDNAYECLKPGKPFIYNGNIAKEWQLKAMDEKVADYELKLNIYTECQIQCAVNCLSREMHRISQQKVLNLRRDQEEQNHIFYQRQE